MHILDLENEMRGKSQKIKQTTSSSSNKAHSSSRTREIDMVLLYKQIKYIDTSIVDSLKNRYI